MIKKICDYLYYIIFLFLKKDKVRTQSYCSAILLNAFTFNGKTILDLGTGSGILSMFMAKAQASQVFAVDEADILYNAIDNFRYKSSLILL